MPRIGYLVSLLLGDLVILLAPPGDLRSAAVFLLLWVLPGMAWAYVLRGRWLEGAGLGAAINALLVLLLHYLPGSIPSGLAIVTFTLSALAPALGWKTGGSPAPPLRPSRATMVLILIAVLFRLPHLGYSEFQGDEGVIMVRAAAALEGDDAELFLHAKGPVEILIPMASWTLGGEIDEFWARLPFCWISVLGVLAIARLGERWFGRRAGWIAGLVLAINGFHVAFGRIIQYQGVVVLMALLALLALDRYRKTGRGQDLYLGALYLAVGGLSHYDAVLFAPAAAALVVVAMSKRSFALRTWRRLALAALLAGVVLGIFYLPYITNPNFTKTAGYLAGDRVGSGLHINAGSAWVMSTVYNSSYYVLLLFALLIPGLAGRAVKSGGLYAWLAFLTPFIFYLLIVFDPRTHLYTIFPGLSILAGQGADLLAQRLARTRWHRALSAVGIGLYLICAGYTWMVFVNHVPEYQRTYPEHSSWLYWTSYSEMPLYGRFGFPHRAGWEAVGVLIDGGVIQGTYSSNEEQEITDLYTRQAPRTHCPQPDVYVIAENVQDEVEIEWNELEREYLLAGTVSVLGEPRIRWYRRADDTPVVPLQVDAAGYRQWWRPDEIAPPTTGGTTSTDVVLGDRVKLVGYDLDTQQAQPGGNVVVTLYWQPLVPLDRNFQVFTHLYDGQMRGQHDGAPECAHNPTTRWEPGQIIPDPHRIEVSPDTSPGGLPLLVGMYDLITGDRLGVTGGEGDSIYLTDVIIQ